MPNRIIKESICTSDNIEALTDFQETFFYCLIVNCDDYGRMDARPAILKARLYPLRERLTLRDIQSALQALADVGCVEVYEVDGKPYLRLPSWEVHQQIRAKKSKYPAPDNTCNQMISDDSKCPRNPIQSESESESESEDPPKPPAPFESSAVVAVIRDYCDRINPTPSPGSLDELKGYVEEMGEAVCKRAFDIALDAKKANWNYIRGILRNKLSQGVHCLADWDALEAEREAEREKKRPKNDRKPQGKPAFYDYSDREGSL